MRRNWPARAAAAILCLFVGGRDAAAYSPDPGYAVTGFVGQSPGGGDARPDVASAADGKGVAVWEGTDADGMRAIFVTVQNAPFGHPLYGFQVSASGAVAAPAVAMDADGDFVVVWESTAGGAAEIHARRFLADGTPEAVFTVSAPGNPATSPDVAMDASGAFVVVWQDDGAASSRILARRFGADGIALGAPSHVDIPSSQPRTDPAVAASAAGAFVVVWQATSDDAANQEVHAAAFGADDSVVLADSRIDATSSNGPRHPAVAMTTGGRFVAVWSDEAGASATISSRRFASDGSPLAGEVALTAAADPGGAAVAMDADAHFIVVWPAQGEGQRQIFDADGLSVVAAGMFSTVSQDQFAVAMDADGDVWLASRTSRWVEAVRIVGPEAIDLSLSPLGVNPNPVVYGSSFSVEVTITNHHPGGVATGFPAIDAAFGLADDADLYMATTGYPYALPLLSCTPSCEGGLPAGATRTLTFGGDTPPAAETLSVSATFSYRMHFDPDPDNEDATTSVPIVCPAGAGGTLILSSTQSTIDEGTSASVLAERIGGSCGLVKVSLLLGGTATPGSDYGVGTYSAGEVSWAAGDATPRTIWISARDDNLDEIADQESVEVSFGAVTTGSGEIASAEPVRFLINDKNPPPRFWAGTLLLYEGESRIFYAHLTHPSERTVRVPATWVGTGGAPADPERDITPPPPIELVFEPGVTRIGLELAGTADGLDEWEIEGLDVVFGAPENAVLNDPEHPNSHVGIVDRDAKPLVDLVTADASVAEGSGIQVRAVLSAPSGREVRVPLVIGGASTDVTLSAMALVFAAGATEAATTLTVLHDGEGEGAETVLVELGPAEYSTALAGADIAATITIPANEPTSVAFARTATTLVEGTKGALISVTLSAPSAFPVTVELVPGGTATAPGDYSTSALLLDIPAGRDAASVFMKIVDDRRYERDEVVTFQIVRAVNALLGANLLHTVTIVDNDGRPRPATHTR